MLVYIAGAGAMGCRFGYQLSKTKHEVVLLDNWEGHIDAIQKEGLRVTGDIEDRVQLPIMRPTEAREVADLIILLTKADQLPKMLRDIRGIIGPETKVLSLLNGLGHATTMRRYIPEESIMVGVTIWLSGLKGPGHVHLEGPGSISLQNMVGDGQSAQAIVELFNEAGLNASYDDNVIEAIWRKACVNGVMNPTCTIMDCTIGNSLGLRQDSIWSKVFSRNLSRWRVQRWETWMKKKFGNTSWTPPKRRPATTHPCTRIWFKMVEKRRLITSMGQWFSRANGSGLPRLTAR